MSDIMLPIPFKTLLTQTLSDYRERKAIYEVSKIRQVDVAPEHYIEFAGQKLENALGVAAGPQTQLAQNLIACYAGGARFMETKTVQRLYGEDLGIPRPCIRANDEGYNVEWSSEYSPKMAADEYIKAWFVCHVIAREFKLGDPNAFQFNMSVGYNLEGIKQPIVDQFLDDLWDASENETFKACRAELLENLDLFEHVTAADIEAIPAHVCNTVTLSTMHGCPADEIEAIVQYLLEVKKLNTMVKLNPTLLGYDYCQKMMQDLDYGYITFDPHSFEADLQWHQAVPMLERLIEVGKANGVFFGVKLSNTMEVKNGEFDLPGNAMYMSGKALYPLTITLAERVANQFKDKLHISYCGGANAKNIASILETGIFPITVCTPLLQNPGYNLLDKMAAAVEAVTPDRISTKPCRLTDIVNGLVDDPNNHKSAAQIKKHAENQGYEPTRQRDKVACKVLCQNCVKVCPNRANTVIETALGKRIVHIDSYCNECGNCQFGCVEPCAPYRDRLTFFATKKLFDESENSGYYFDGQAYDYRLYGEVGHGGVESLPEEIRSMIESLADRSGFVKLD